MKRMIGMILAAITLLGACNVQNIPGNSPEFGDGKTIEEAPEVITSVSPNIIPSPELEELPSRSSEETPPQEDRLYTDEKGEELMWRSEVLLDFVFYRWGEKDYHFLLSKGGKFVVYGRTYYKNDYSANEEDKVGPVETASVQLFEEDMAEIKDLVGQIQKGEMSQIIALKPHIMIAQGLPNGIKTFSFSFGASKNDSMNKLMNKLVELAPYDIVNDAGEVLTPRTEEDVQKILEQAEQG